MSKDINAPPTQEFQVTVTLTARGLNEAQQMAREIADLGQRWPLQFQTVNLTASVEGKPADLIKALGL